MTEKSVVEAVEYQESHNGYHSEKQAVDDRDLDLAAQILQNHSYDYTPEEARRVRLKIDLHLMPVLCFTGVMSAVDKIIISNAALYGMKTDLHLTPGQYSWVGSIVSLGFLVMEWPSSLLVQRLPLSKLLTVTVFLWSVFTMCQGATTNFAGIMVLRVFLGMAEAPVFLICQTYVVMMYKADEQPLRIAIFLASIATLFIGPVSYGIGVTSGTSIAPWRLLYITFGGITFLWSIALWFLLPDNPASWKILSDKEKYVAIHRVQENQTGIENKVIKYRQILEALLDPKNWVLFVYQVLLCSYLGGLTSFAALIVNSFGFDKLHTV
jgi:ACS family allantoate permease-like MFS transporter